jgi:hypothetical protein
MTVQAPTMMRCERCKAVINAAHAAQLIRRGASCGVCGGRLVLCRPERRMRSEPATSGDGRPRLSSEHRLLTILREAHGRPIESRALVRAGIGDPASAIYELGCAEHRIERAYTNAIEKRHFLGYVLRTNPTKPR